MAVFPEGSLVQALEKSIKENESLLPVDLGLVATARVIARRIDDAVAGDNEAKFTKLTALRGGRAVGK